MTSKFRDQIKDITELLYQYTCSKTPDMSLRQLSSIYLIYAIIMQNIVDYHEGKGHNKKSAADYFKSALFETHCALVGIDKKLMERIAFSKNNYQEIIGEFE